MPVPLLDLKAEFAPIAGEVRAAIEGVLESQRFILGPEVQALEQEIAEYSGTAHAIGVSSGSDALIVALMALDIGPGDEVITTPFTFFATLGAIARVGAKPVLVDIDPQTYNLDPGKLEAAITDRTRAIIPVHLYGQCADMPAIMDIANRHDLPVIEDAAQAIGSEIAGRRAGSFGALGCFSFFPSKNLGALGDGGMVVTSDPALAEKTRILRGHGGKPKYYHQIIGGNFRLDALHAAVLRVKLPHLDDWTAARQRNAATYDRLFAEAGLTDTLTLPHRVPGARHIFNQYVIRAPRRDELKQHLTSKNIGTEIYYPVPMHLQDCFAYLEHKPGDFPACEQAAQQTLAIPVYPSLTNEQQAEVVDAIREFHA